MVRGKILIADDDADILDAMQMVLQIADYDVQVIRDGKKVIGKVKDTKPSVLLLDLWMSGISGVDICNKIRKEKGMQNLPIILISASNDIKKHALDGKFNDIIAKPFDMRDLLDKVAHLLPSAE